MSPRAPEASNRLRRIIPKLLNGSHGQRLPPKRPKTLTSSMIQGLTIKVTCLELADASQDVTQPSQQTVVPTFFSSLNLSFAPSSLTPWWHSEHHFLWISFGVKRIPRKPRREHFDTDVLPRSSTPLLWHP